MVTLKKKTFGYSERSEEARSKFLKKLETIDPKDIIYADEAGMDDNETTEAGWCKKGERLNDVKNSQPKKRISFISALSLQNIIGPFIFEGPCTRDVFEIYLKQVLIPIMKPGQILIIDNASFHKGGRILQLIKKAKCDLIYLPTYSPDLNPIEHYWSAIKNKIRKFLTPESPNIYEAAISAFGSF